MGQTVRARIDLAGFYAYIGERSLESARRFRKAANETFVALARSPGIGEPYEIANPRFEGLRCARVRRFRSCLSFYRPIEGGIEVIRILHAARNIGEILETDEGD